MERLELTAERRTVAGKAVKELRRQGLVPAVIYGHGFEPQSVQLDARALRRTLTQAGGSHLITITIAGAGEPAVALAREVQRDPITGELLHVDFYRVRMTERIRTEIPLVIAGESPVVEMKEGLLLQGLSAVEVECLPGDLVDAILVDVSGLDRLDTSLHVRDLVLPPGIEVLTDPDEMVVRVVPLAEREEELEAPVAEVTEVEVVGRRPKAEEEAEEE